MLPRADAISPVGRADAIARLDGTADPRLEAFQRSMSGMLGRQVQGEVLARLKDGSFLVKLDGTAARMQLPPGTEVGKGVPMTLLSLTPRPTFQVAVQGQAGQMLNFEADAAPPGAAAPYLNVADGTAGRTQSGAAQLSQAAALVPQTAADKAAAAAQLAPGAAAAPVTLSATARVLSNVLSTALALPQPGDSIVARTALSERPGAPPAQLAAALQNAVGKSGLFYESHVAQWSSGERSLADLGDEPQMQRALTSEGQARAHTLTDPVTAHMINLQLQTQEQARVAWQGQIWPGQDMRWEIRRDESEPGGKHGAEAPEEPGWHSALRLRFPLLGEIGAKLVIRGEQLHLQIDAGSGVSALLRAQAGRLESAMQAAGTPLSSLNISSAPEAGNE